MANTYELIVKTVDQSTRSLRNIERGLASLERRSRGVSLALKGVGAAIVAVVSARALSNVIQITSTFEDLQTTLNTVTGSAEAGANAFSFIQRFATQTQFGIEDLSNAFIKLQGAGITPTERLLTTFTDTAAVTTDQLGTLEAITDLLARTTGGGLGLDNLERLADRGIPVYRILQEEIGLARNEISEFGQTAEGAAQITEALLRGLDRNFGGATSARLQNLSTLVSNLGIATRNAIGEFGAGLAPALKEVIAELTNFINGNQGFFRSLGQLAGDTLRGISAGIKELASTLGLIQPGGLQNALAVVLDGFADLAQGVATSVDSLVNGVKAGAALIQQAVVAVSRLLSSIPGINFEFKLGIEGEGLEGTIDRLAREARNADIALTNAMNNSLIVMEESKLRQMEMVINGLRRQFDDQELLADPVFQSLGLQVMEQRRLVESMYAERSASIQSIVDEESQKIRDRIQAGELLIISPFDQTPSNVLSATQPVVDAIRQRADEIRAAAEEAQRAAAIQVEFPPYDDAILRVARGLGVLSAEQNNASQTMTPLQQRFDEVVAAANKASEGQDLNRQVLGLLIQAYRDGTISLQVYNQALAQIGATATATGNQLSAYQQFLNQTISSATQSAQQIGFASQAQADLRTQLENGQISIDTYAQAMQNLNSILGITTETTTGGGGAAQAIETINSTYEKGIEAIAQYELNARNVSGAMQLLERDFANGNLSLEQFGIAMQGVGGNMDDIQNRSIALGLSITESFESAGDGLARGLARGIARGEGVMQSFKNFMQNILEEILYQIIQQAFIKPLISSMTSGLSAAFGAFGRGGVGAFGGGGLGLLGGLFGGGGGLFGILGSFLGFANGGVVPGRPTAGDSVPILATPGEVILNKQQQAEVMRGGSDEPITVNFNINAIDTQSGTEFILQNKKQITSVIQQAYNTRGRQGPLG